MRRFVAVAIPAVAVLALLSVWSAPARAADEKRVTITGTVVDASGAAVADAQVRLVPPRPAPAAGGGGAANLAVGKGGKGGPRPEPLASATTDKDGKFTLTATKDIPDGDYNVIAMVQGKGFARQAVKVAGNVATPDKVELKLAPREGGKGKGGDKGGDKAGDK